MPTPSTVAIPITSTGIGSNGQPLPPGEADPKWSIILGPPGFQAQPAYVVSNPPATYFSNAPNSQWIWLDAGGNAGDDFVAYTFRRTFDLSYYNLSTVKVTGTKWGVDNSAILLLNGQTTNVSLPGNAGTNYSQGSTFELTSGFVQGLNTLDFLVTNTGGPGALNVQVSASGTPLYSPSNKRDVNLPDPGTAMYASVLSPDPGDQYVDVDVALTGITLEHPEAARIMAQVIALEGAQENSLHLRISRDGPFARDEPHHYFMTHILGLFQNQGSTDWIARVRVLGIPYPGTSDHGSGDRERQASTWPPGTGVVVVVNPGGSK